MEGREDIESFRLKMILRLLQIASFNGKMNALNEVIVYGRLLNPLNVCLVRSTRSFQL
jgi:hypothetical protein